MSDSARPVVKDGLEYWETQPATLDGVLGGFGNGTLPYVDALTSRQFLTSLRPDLCTVPSALRPLIAPKHQRRIRALDIGAGIGRVTQDVLLHLVDEVVLVEPIAKFLAQAQTRSPIFKGIADKTRGVLFIKSTLQMFDPRNPPDSNSKNVYSRAGAMVKTKDEGYDVVWMQWCLGHMTDDDLIQLLKASKDSLRGPAVADDQTTAGVIIVKENCCVETTSGEPQVIFSQDDSSVTRSNLAWIKCFTQAGLSVLRNEVQQGFPEGLFPVRLWALR